MALLLKERSMQRAAILTAALLTAGLAIQGAYAAPNISIPRYITAAVADSARPAADTERDASRKPAETLAFAGVKPGDWVLELAPARVTTLAC
jgi:predicted methyltransferase